MPYGDFTPENNFGEQGCGDATISGPREHGRPEVFCKDVTMLENLEVTGDVVISGNVTIAGTLTVGGTIKAPFFDGVAKEAITAKSLG